MIKKRILLISNTTQSFWIYRRDLIRHFIESGYDVHCAAPPDDSISQVQSLGATVHAIPLSRSGINPVTEIRSFWALWTLIRRIQPAVIFAYTIKPNSYVPILAKVLSIPCISIVTGLGYSFISKSIKALISRSIFTHGLSLSTEIWAYNHQDQNDLIAHKKSITERTSLIPGSGINLYEFSTENNQTPLTKMSISFLMISRLLIDKGVREYIAASKTLKQEYPEIECHLLGPLDPGNPTAIPKSELDDAVRSGIIQYHPETKDVRPFIARSDCIVLPSYREGIPKVLLEAGAMGKASITTDAPGCRDVIRNGENGFIIPPRDFHALTHAMINFIQMATKDREKMSTKAREYIVKDFSNEIVFQKYDDILKNIPLRGGEIKK